MTVDTDLPSNAGFGFIEARYLMTTPDSGDPDRFPDGAAVIGTVTLTPPTLEVVDVGASAIVAIFMRPLTFNLDTSGYLVGTDGERGAWVTATDDVDLGIVDWTYQVTRNFSASGLSPLTYHIRVPELITTDLNDRTKWVSQSLGVVVEPPVDPGTAPFGISPFGISVFGGIAV